jgi:hypothetical protein
MKMTEQKNLFAIIFCALLCMSYQMYTLSSSLKTSHIFDRILYPKRCGCGVGTNGLKRIGDRINYVSEFVNNGIYCMRAVHSSKTIGVTCTKQHHVEQNGKTCNVNTAYRLLKYNNEFRFMNIRTKKFLTESVRHPPYNNIYLKTRDNPHDPRQRWRIENFSQGQFQIFGSKSNFVFDILGNSHKDHAKMVAYGRNPKNANQRFTFSYLGIYDGSETAIKFAPADVDRTGNKFVHNGIYCMRAAHSYKPVGFNIKNPHEMVQNSGGCFSNNSYRIVKCNNEYRFMNMLTKKFLTEQVIEGRYHKIIQSDDDPHNPRQKWRIEKFGHPGEFQIFNLITNYVFDILGNTKRNYARLVSYGRNPRRSNQRFKFKFLRMYTDPHPPACPPAHPSNNHQKKKYCKPKPPACPSAHPLNNPQKKKYCEPKPPACPSAHPLNNPQKKKYCEPEPPAWALFNPLNNPQNMKKKSRFRNHIMFGMDDDSDYGYPLHIAF